MTDYMKSAILKDAEMHLLRFQWQKLLKWRGKVAFCGYFDWRENFMWRSRHGLSIRVREQAIQRSCTGKKTSGQHSFKKNPEPSFADEYLSWEKKVVQKEGVICSFLLIAAVPPKITASNKEKSCKLFTWLRQLTTVPAKKIAIVGKIMKW